MGSWNHVGLCVTDLDRSIRFYGELFGFEERNRMPIPDAMASKLLRIPEPVGLTAVYLVLGAGDDGPGGTVLELVHFDRPGNDPQRDRSITEPGLTHVSFTVDDVAAACGRVRELGGEVLDDTDVGGVAILIRDPDGQLLELLAPGTAPT